MATKKVERVTTPKGVAKYPWLKKPDTRFNPNGVFQVKLIIEQNEAAPLCELLDARAQAAYDKAVEDAKTPQIKKAIKLNAPYAPEFDAEGNETGRVEFRFKTNATADIKGETVNFAPKCFDAKGKEMPMPNVYGGSEIKVNFTPAPYYNAATKTAGVSLRMNAVQVIKLVTGGGGDASSFGFAEEEGFEFADEKPETDAGEEATSGSEF